jgi:uncharacterized protein
LKVIDGKTGVSAAKEIDGSNFGPIHLVVIQPTSFCNLDCDYCYLPHRQVKNQLSLDLIEPIFQMLLTSRWASQDFTVCWHAGEPLAMPIEFYQAAFARAQAVSQSVNNDAIGFGYSFQTNGILINQAWCELFQRHPVHVGVSIDGPAFIHDAHRQTRTGLGSHAATMRGIAQLQRNNIPFDVISVITREALDYPDEIFHFFLEHGITDVGFNMEEIEGTHQTSTLDHDGVDDRYRAFMQRIWELTVEHQGALQVREFETLCSLVYSGARLESTDMNRPFVIVNIDYQGNFATFDPELLAVQTDRYGQFILGNVLQDTLESVCATDKFQRIYREMAAGVEQCRQTCDYFGVCGGGAGSNKYWENGTLASAETLACRQRIQVITDIVLDSLESTFL